MAKLISIIIISCSSYSANNSAVAPDDYIALTGVDVIFPSGSTDGALECVNITIVDDNTFEGPHSFSVEIIMASSPSVIGSPSSATINIEDDEGMFPLLLYHSTSRPLEPLAMPIAQQG